MPRLADLKDKISFELYSCPEFSIEGVLFPGNRLHLHLDWPRKHLTASIYKQGLLAIKMIRQAAANRGIEAIYTLVPGDLVKFEEMFGFHAIEMWSNRFNPEKPLYLMKQETV